MLTQEQILSGLKHHFPTTRIELDHENPFQFVLAIILSAQTTDKRVNTVTPVLFAKYPTPKDLAEAEQEEVEEIIHPLGTFRMKAKNIIGCARTLVEEFGGEVPATMEELVKLPGVGRKSASAVLVKIWGVPAIVVDTHMIRVSNRLKITEEKPTKNPEIVERYLAKFFDKEHWIYMTQAMVLFGRYVCMARKPQCDDCAMADFCPSEDKRI